jgi:peptidoglycan/xylan/chitin deacetylase (PgdA/CDA1 family)
MFFRSPLILPLLYPTLTWRIPTESMELYLTFDDGPVPGPTEFVLGELARVNAKATFFCIGDNVDKHPDIFQQIKSAEHAIGNHTFHHVKGWNFSTDEYLKDVSLCQAELARSGISTTGQNGERMTGLFRPPYGRITRAQVKALSDYRVIMWDVLTHDYLKDLSPEKCLRRSVKATRPGSIIVFHDSLKAEKNLTYVLPRFLDHFSNLGYSFKPISNA